VKLHAYVLIGLIGLLSTGEAPVTQRCMCTGLQLANSTTSLNPSVRPTAAEPLSIDDASPVDEPDQEPAWCVGSDDPRCNPRHNPQDAPRMNGGASAITLAWIFMPPPMAKTSRLAAERDPRNGVRSRVDRPPQI